MYGLPGAHHPVSGTSPRVPHRLTTVHPVPPLFCNTRCLLQVCNCGIDLALKLCEYRERAQRGKSRAPIVVHTLSKTTHLRSGLAFTPSPQQGCDLIPAGGSSKR